MRDSPMESYYKTSVDNLMLRGAGDKVFIFSDTLNFSEQTMKAVWLGFKTRKILDGERIQPILIRIHKL